MRIGLFAIAIVLGSFSPPPCQKTNPAFEGEDAGGSESGHDGSSTSGNATSDASSGMSETTVTDASGTMTDDGADGETTESAESTTEGPCPDPGHELCSGTCVDTTTNRDHCGMCGYKCHPVMQNCENSVCVPA
jgi:hypothetical protein